MTVTPQMFVEAAREWVGTPFKHQGRVKGSGVDCIGVPYCVARDFGMVDTSIMVPYHREPDGRLLPEILGENLVRVTKPQAGDIMLFRFVTHPQHVAVYTGRNIIHSYSRVGRCTEHIFDQRWKRRLVATYRFKEFMQ
jgi:cell wall-associated NlpC family hydrolase